MTSPRGLAGIKKTPAWLISLLAIAGLAGCGGSLGPPPPPPPNPVPSIASLSPTSANAGGAAFTLTVNGSNFISSSVVQWNGSSRTTSYVSATQLTAAIAAPDIAVAGNASVTVMNPTPGGGTSSAVTVAVNDPVPAITSVSPSSAVAGGPAFTLTVNGSGFLTSSVIQWNGNNRTTSFVSATQLTTTISVADIAVGQNAAIVVMNPSPGGGASAEVSLAINTPAPSVASISPSSAVAGGGGFTLTVTGSNFLPGSTVQWNGSYGQPPLATSYVSATELTVAIPASDIAFAGNVNVTVVSPGPAGGISAASVFAITGSIPSNVSFVAPNGSDSNPGTIIAPYLTIQKCATTVSSGSICAIRAGTYRETVTPNSGITITSYDGEPVTVDGSDPVTGWTQYQGSIYKTTVALSSGDSNQIFVGNQMMTEARWPNGNDLFHVNWATAQAGTSVTQIVDSNLPNINWTGANIHLWSGMDPYSHQTGTVTASAQGKITIDVPTIAACPTICPAASGYYYLFGILGALDTENEWYYDSTAGVLYFWAPGGVNPSTLSVTARQRQYAFDFSGTSNVTIESINLFSGGINSDPSSTNIVIDGINAQYLSHFTMLPAVPGDTIGFEFIGDHWVDTGIVLYGTGHILRNSAISYSAGSGVVVQSTNTSVTNNLIHHIDYMGNFASGVNFFGASGNSLDNNTIYSAGRAAVGIESFDATHTIVNGDIGYNNLFDAMMLSRDGGEIYAGPPLVVTQTSIHDNWIHDTQSLISGSADNYPSSGVYIDNDAAGFEVDQNILWNNEYESVILHGANLTTANDNDVQNNMIPDINSNSYIWLYQIPDCGTTQVVNNLILVAVNNVGNGPTCSVTNNGPTAPGVTDTITAAQVGCNFAGCSSEGPPAISGNSVAASIAVQPYNMTVTAGQPATVSVTGAGSPPLAYQWQRNGANITGATNASYTISAASAADNGAVFSVTVSNSLGSVASNFAILTVQ